MPLPPIAVEIAPPDQSPDLVQVLLDACSRAASPVACSPADSPTADGVSALAIVIWEPKSDGVHIQVGAKRGQNRGDWISRRIDFEDSDEETERWTATGFVVGTLASRFFDATAQEAPEVTSAAPELDDAEPASSAEKPSSKPKPGSSSLPALARRRLWLDAAAFAGPLFDRGPWRFGGMLGVAYLGEGWPVFAYTALGQAWRPRDSHDVVARVTEGELGVGLPMTRGEHWNLDVTSAATLERLHVDVRGRALKRAPVTHWVAGAQAGLELSWSLNDLVGGVCGARMVWWSHNTTFQINEEDVATQQSVIGEVSLGLRVSIR